MLFRSRAENGQLTSLGDRLENMSITHLNCIPKTEKDAWLMERAKLLGDKVREARAETNEAGGVRGGDNCKIGRVRRGTREVEGRKS